MCLFYFVRRFNEYVCSMNNVNSVLVYDDDIDLSLLHIVSGYESANRDLMIQDLLNIPLEPYKPSVDVNRRSGPGNDYWTSAHIAACWGHHSTLKLLLENGALPEIPDRNGHDVWEIARAYDNFLCVAVLQQFLYQKQANNAPAPTETLQQSKPETDLQTRLTNLDLNTTQTDYFTCSSDSDTESVSCSQVSLTTPVSSQQCQKSSDLIDNSPSCDRDHTPVMRFIHAPLNPNPILKFSQSENHYHSLPRSVGRVRTNLLKQINEFKVGSSEKKKPSAANQSTTIDSKTTDPVISPVVCLDLLTDDETDTPLNDSSRTLVDEQMDSDLASSDETSNESDDSFDESSVDSSIRKSIISQDNNKSVELYEDMQFGVSLLNESHKSNLNLSTAKPSVVPSTAPVCKTSTMAVLHLEHEFAQLNHTQLRSKLLENGMSPGPINDCTKKLYVKKLCVLLQRNSTIASPLAKSSPISSPIGCGRLSYSAELTALFQKKFDFSKAKTLELDFQNYFERIHCSKVYFTYLLLDPRETLNLMDKARGGHSDAKLFEQFVRAIFYIGKGQGNRPFMHLYEAALLNNNASRGLKKSPNPSKKLLRILDIWNSDRGVVSLHCFHSISSQEALTRECFMINAIGLQNLTNIQIGQNRVKDLLWTEHKKNYLGSYLLYKAFNLYLVNGERQIRKADVEG